MRVDLLEFIGLIFEKTWEIFSINFPGTNIPIAGIIVGTVIIALGINLLARVLNVHFRFGQRGGNNEDIQISEGRRNDSY